MSIRKVVTGKWQSKCKENCSTSNKNWKILIHTGAHCILDKYSSIHLSPNDLVVLLGAYDLNNPIESGRVVYSIESINLHPDWLSGTHEFDADIAILLLTEDVVYTKFIKPVCLIPDASPIANIRNVTAVGFGQSEDDSKLHENMPKELKMPWHVNEDCFLKNKELVRLSSKRTFCIGNGDGLGVCKGDSGGGLYVEYQGTFYLRAIISSSLFQPNQACDLDTYSVATNIMFYNDWIEKVDRSPYLYGRK